MNKTYNVVFNQSIGEYQVTSELTSNQKKTKSSKRVVMVIAALLLTAGVHISEAQLIVDSGRTEIHQASNIAGDLSNVEFHIKDNDIPSSEAFKDSLKAYMGKNQLDDKQVNEAFNHYVSEIHESIEEGTLGHLYVAAPVNLTVTTTLKSSVDHNIVMRADSNKELKLVGATTTIFDNNHSLIMTGKDFSDYPYPRIYIIDNKITGDLIKNTGMAYFSGISFFQNSGTITNLGTMILQDSIFNKNEGKVIHNEGTLFVKGGEFNDHRGAFFTIKGDTFIDNVEFKNNNNDGASMPSQYMIGIEGGTTVVKNSTFRDSNQRSISVNNAARLIVENSNFENLRVDTNNAGALDGYQSSYFQVSDSTFRKNHTSNHGGAIAFVGTGDPLNNRLFINNDFIKNSAAGLGGAIYGYSDFTIAVDKEKVSTFRGNLRNDDGSGVGYIANSLSSSYDNNVVLRVDGILDMLDPMYALGTVIKHGAGTWKLGGSNSNIDNIEIQEGELYLYKASEAYNQNKYTDSYPYSFVEAGSFQLDGNFILGAVGKYASISASDNTIQATNIYLNNSGKDRTTTLDFRIDEETSFADYILTLEGNTQASNIVNINIDSYDLQDATYKLLKTTGQTGFDLNKYHLMINGNSPADGNRLENGFSLGYGNDQKTIELAASELKNVVNFWGYKDGNELDLWNQLHDKNWSHSTGEFLNGDLAVFDGKRAGTVRIADDVHSAAIIVNGSENYRFEGSIIVDGDKTTLYRDDEVDDYGYVFGQLVVGAHENSIFNTSFTGILDLTGTKDNQFSSGIEIESGTIKISRLDQLGKDHPYVVFSGDSNGTLLISDNADITVGGSAPFNFYIDSGKSAYFKTEDHAKLSFWNYSNPLTGLFSVQGNPNNLVKFNDSSLHILSGGLIQFDHVHFSDGMIQLYNDYQGSGLYRISNSLIDNSTLQFVDSSSGDLSINLEDILLTNGSSIDLQYLGDTIFSRISAIDNHYSEFSGYTSSALSASASFTMNQSHFLNNTGLDGSNGAAIAIRGHYADKTVAVSISESFFSDNVVKGQKDYWDDKGRGGAIYVEEGDISLDIELSQFSGNRAELDKDSEVPITAASGGAIFIRGGNSFQDYNTGLKTIVDGILSIENSTFLNNHADNFGGAIAGIRWKDDQNDSTIDPIVNIFNTDFTRNSALNSGGGIYGIFKELNITWANFEDNISSHSGGALSVTGEKNTIINSNFIGNKANDLGGAIDFQGTLNLVADGGNVLFLDNSIDGGGYRVSNAIHAYENSILNINAKDTHKVVISDALTGANNITVNKVGSGTWELGSDALAVSFLNHAANFGDNTHFSIKEGTFSLYENTGLAFGKDSTVTFGSADKSSTALFAGNNTIVVKGGKILFNTGDGITNTTLGLILTDQNKIIDRNEATAENSALNLEGIVKIEGQNSLNLDISGITSGNNLYALIYTSIGNQFDLDRFNLLENQSLIYNGESIDNIERLSGLSLELNDQKNALILNSGGAAVLTTIANWNGSGDVWMANGHWNTIDSAGKSVQDSLFVAGDYANLALMGGTLQTINIDSTSGKIDSAGIYVSGDTDYIFDGTSLTAAKHQTTFNPKESSGKFIIGQEVMSNGADLSFNDKKYTGTVDLTSTFKNNFEGGVDIHSGTLKISHQDQLGVTSLHDLKLSGSKDHSAMLLVADGGDVVFDKQTLTISQDKFATIQNEGTGKLIFRNHVTGGTSIYNYGTLSIVGASTNNLIHFNGTNNKGNQTIINRGDLDIINTKFTGHGAYYAGNLGIEQLSGNVGIKDSIFENYYYAIDSNNPNTVITLKNVDFKNNSRRAIDITAGTVYIEDGVFAGNGSSNTNHGGAIYSYDRVNISGNALFTNHFVSQSGAAVTNTGLMIIEGANFASNSAGESGGAIYNYQLKSSDLAQLQVTDVILTDNSANQHGGAIYTGNGSTTTITNATLTDNSASQYGGAIYVATDSVTAITDTNFIGNSAGVGAGAIYNAGVLNLNVTEDHEMLFKDNTVPNQSGSMDQSDILMAENAVLNIHTEKGSTLEMNGSLLGETGNTTIAKDGIGVWALLSGKVSFFSGKNNIAVKEGILHLGKGSGLVSSDGVFSIGSSGKNTSLSVSGKNILGNIFNGDLDSKTILHTGDSTGSTTLNFTVGDENTIASLADAAAVNSILNVYGNLEIQGAGQIDVNVDLTKLSNASTGGLYSLLYSNNGGLNANQFNLNSTLIINGRDTSTVDRLKSLSLLFSDHSMVLNKGGVYHGVASWNGAVNNEWNAVDENWSTIDSQGQSWKTFMNNDFVNFTQSGNHTIVINGKIVTSGAFFSGDGTYRFDGQGFSTTDKMTSFNIASGKLILGQVMNQNAVLIDAEFTGIVDLSHTTENSFTKGVDVYGGTLKIASSDQLGTSLDKLKLAGTASNVATLVIKADSDLHFEETLTIDNSDVAALHLEENAELTLSDNSINGINIAGGSLTLNTAAGAVLDIQNQLAGNNATLTKVGVGTLKLAGNNQLTNDSKVNFAEGLVDLAENASLQLEGVGSALTLGSDGKDMTLAVNGGNQLSVDGDLILNAGGEVGSTTLSFNLDDDNHAATESDINTLADSALNIAANNMTFTNQGANNSGIKLQINDIDSLDKGFYSLLHSKNGLNQNLFASSIKAMNDQNVDRFNAQFLTQNAQSLILEKGMLYRGIARWNGNQSVWADGSFKVADSKGRNWDQFVDNDYVIFGLMDGSTQSILLSEKAKTAGIYVSGDSDYMFDGEGLATNKVDISDFTSGSESQGKLVLGQTFDDQLTISDADFTGVVDFTNTDRNIFEGGVDIHSGTLKVGSKDQLGTSLDELSLMGKSADKAATLAIAKDADITFVDETLTIKNGDFAVLSLDEKAKVTFSGADKAINLDGGALALNTAAGSILDLQSQLTGQNATLNKDGAGTLKLASNNTLLGDSMVSINAGILDLAKAATLELAGTGSSFTFGKEGGHSTLVANGQNTIASGNHNGNIIFNTGNDAGTSTTLKLKVTEDNKIANTGLAGSGNAVLTFAGNVQITGQNGVNIDLFGLSSGAEGLYTLLYTTGATKFDKANFSLDQNITFQGRALKDVARLSGMGLIVEDSAVILNKDSVFSAVATWTGGKDLIWNGTSSNWNATDSTGKIWNTFVNGDFVNFAALSGKDTQNISIKDAVTTAGIYFSGEISYLFSGEGITTAQIKTTFDPAVLSNGKFVLGQKFGTDLSLVKANFTGLVDLTGTTKNSFKGGVEIYGGILRVATKDQLGIKLDEVLFVGSDQNTATLAIAKDSALTFTNESLVVDSDHHAALTLEEDASVTFNSNGNTGNGIEINGGNLMLNTAAGAILEMQNQLGGNDASFSKFGQGTLKLAGDNQFTGQSAVSLLEGTINFAHSANLGLSGADSTLTLGRHGQSTRIVANGHNRLDVNGDLILNNSADMTFAFNVSQDNYSATKAGIASSLAVLSLDAEKLILSNTVNAGGIQVDLLNTNLASLDKGYYTLLSSNQTLVEGLFDANLKGHTNQDRFNTLFLAQDENHLVLEKDIVYSGVANWLGGNSFDNNESNWSATDSKGRTWKEFANNDYINFGLVGSSQTIDLGTDAVNSAGLYFNGDSTYAFTGKGFNTSMLETTFGANRDEMSSGKLVLGQSIVANGGLVNIADRDFSGGVDLTGTEENHFEGGVDIYGGTLRVANEKQLGTTLDELTLAGNRADNAATLQLAEKGALNLKDQSLTIDQGFAKLDLEKEAALTLAGNGGVNLNGGTFTLNTAAGAIADLNHMSGNGNTNATFNKTGQGSLKLAGNNEFTGKTDFNVLEGTFNLANGGSVQLQGQGSSFTLGSAGKNTTFIINGQNTIDVNGTLVFQGGGANGNTILSFNVTDQNYITSLGLAGSGNAGLNIGDYEVKDGPIKIDIGSISSAHDSGLYTLLYTSGKISAGDFNLKDPLTYQGKNITDIARLKDLTLIVQDDTIVLNKDKVYTGVATWVSGGVWNSTTDNWNVKDSSGQTWETFMSSDFVNFAATSDQNIRIGEDLHAADIFFSGDASYLFSEKGLASKVITSTFEPGKESSGKLVLGQKIANDLVISDATFSGVVDLTKTVKNSFEGGVDIHSGSLRIADTKQLGTMLDQLQLMGSEDHVAALVIAEKGDLTLEDQTLTIKDDHHAALTLEKDAKMTLANSGANSNLDQKGLMLNGGVFTLNTAIGSFLDLQNGLGSDLAAGDVTFNKLGSGSLKLAGNTEFSSKADFNILDGTINLAKEANLQLQGAGSSFTLGSEGKITALVANGKNAIDVNGDLILNTGKLLAEGSKDPKTETSLSFNLTDENHILSIDLAAKDNAALYLGGTLKIEGENQVNINVDSLNSAHNSGLYTLLYTAGKLDANQFNLQHHLTYQGKSTADIDRLKHITLVVDDQAIVLDKGTLYTGIATWVAPDDSKDAIWDSAKENWSVSASNGQTWKTFLEGDIVNFASDKSQSIKLADGIVAGDIYVSGRSNYSFNGKGITIKQSETTFDPTNSGTNVMSSGKLVLGQKITDQFVIEGKDQGVDYSGRVDLTGTEKNLFEGGIDIHGGALRIATLDQLGTPLDKVNFLGQSNGGIATLAVKSDSHLNFMDETLTVNDGSYARLQLERDAKVTFESGSDLTDPKYRENGIDIKGGLLTLNTATGSAINMKNGLTGHDATLNKIGSGALKLQGETNLTGTSRVNIQEGLVDLANNGTFTLGCAGSSFTLGSTGRHTILHLAGNNRIDVDGDIILNTGGKNGSTTLAFDVKEENRFDIHNGETATKDNAVLNINASGDLKTSSEGEITIDIAALASNQAGLYTLLYTQHLLDPSKFNSTLSYKGRSTADIERLNVLGIEVGDHSIVINQGVIYNGKAIWTGAVTDKYGTAIWDVAEKNWEVTDSAGKTWETFVDRDSVVFGDLPGKNQNIKIQAGSAGHIVESILVDSQYDYSFSGDQITMENGLTKEDQGSLIFNNSGLTGNLTLNEGMLVIGGGKSALDVKGDITANKGTLAGFATIDGDVTIGKGAILSPGYGAQPSSTAFGTLIANSFNFQEGSTFVVDADEKGNHDKIIASIKNGGTGIVSIDKDVAMDVRAGAGSWHAGQSVVVVEADTEVNGSFDKLTTNLDFLDANLDYSQKDQVTLNLKRNDNSFNSVGLTYNGRSVAGALDGLGNDHAVSKAFQGMTFAEAARSFDNVSGEIYASTQKAIFQSSQAIGQKMKSRLALRESEAFMGVSNLYAQDSLWMEALGYDGTIRGDGNAAKMERKGTGLLIGYDKLISTEHNFSLGFAGGYEDMKLKLKDTRSSESKVKSIHLMAYAGTQLGDSGFDLKGGFNYSYLRYNTDRNVQINSIAGTAKSKHKGHQYQVFAEVSRMFEVPSMDNMEIMPYFGMSHTEIKSNGFKESGSLAALEANRQSNSQTNAVIGVRNNWYFGDNNEYALRTDLGWQYDFGNKFQDYDLQFVGTGPSYNVRSTTSSRSSALVGIGFTGKKDNLEFNVGYQGQFGSKVQDHAINASLIWHLKYNDNGRSVLEE